MWTYSNWRHDDSHYTVFYDGHLPIVTWKQVALHLGIDSVYDYVKFLRDNYPSVRIQTLTGLDADLMGLSIDFYLEDDARRLAELCNERSK